MSLNLKTDVIDTCLGVFTVFKAVEFRDGCACADSVTGDCPSADSKLVSFCASMTNLGIDVTILDWYSDMLL